MYFHHCIEHPTATCFSRTMMLYAMCSTLVLTLSLLCVLHSDSVLAATSLQNDTDGLSLLAFKAQITDDPLQVLSSWNNSISFCEWQGVTCSQRHGRVTSLNLSGKSLLGSISPYIGNLSFLRLIDLQHNRLQGAIPQDIGRLFRLQYLDLENNTLEGKIPSNLTYCSELRILDLARNNLIGNIPPELGSLSKLVALNITQNDLSGSIPSTLGNLSSLQNIVLSYNALEGSIPDTFGQMSSLMVFAHHSNRLSGRIPPSWYNVSSINVISLAVNQLEGNLPQDIGLKLPNLQMFGIAENQFSGLFPLSFPNSSQLELIDISDNNFTGKVPSNLGRLNLRWLNIGSNRFGTGRIGDLNFLTFLTNCTSLEKLGLASNGFGGVLPHSFSNLSTKLDLLDVSFNQISGSIPLAIRNLVSLNTLWMTQNLFTGSIPTSLGELQNLQRLYLDQNRLTGQIPSSLGNISQLSDLYLTNNSLEGSIPESLGNCPALQKLEVSTNKLNGSIPEQFIGLNNQPFYVDLSQNALVGPLPAQIGRLTNLQYLDASSNAFSGEIPSTLGNCLILQQLYLSENSFQGSIPASLVDLKGLQELDLSKNNLSGNIPAFLENLPSLQRLNLSFNDFKGEVPTKGVFRNASAVSFAGNSNLCGGISTLQLPTCSTKESVKHCKSPNLKLIIAMISLSICVLLVLCFLLYCWRRKPRMEEPCSTPVMGDQHFMVSYKDLLQATDGFSSMNLIGSGSFGHVYKGTLSHFESTIAVKVFNHRQKGASKSFLAECEALRNIRHRNLVKILTSCSSLDFEGNDFKALVFEFMPNGSLEKWLYPDANDGQSQPRRLDLIQKLNIAVDVASAMNYLHHQCHIPIIHCDLKPSNVLLDNEMIAHVGDFGLARLLSRTTKNFSMTQTTLIGIKGSIGYAAPEYGMGTKASTQGDVYSYGILLLEMFLGRKPTDEMFKDGLNLHKFARTVLSECVSGEEVKPEENIHHTESLSLNKGKMQECQVTKIKVGVACSAESPGERMNMNDVATELRMIRDIYFASMERGQV